MNRARHVIKRKAHVDGIFRGESHHAKRHERRDYQQAQSRAEGKDNFISPRSLFGNGNVFGEVVLLERRVEQVGKERNQRGHNQNRAEYAPRIIIKHRDRFVVHEHRQRQRLAANHQRDAVIRDNH